jgi:hypothetical protein
VTYQTSEWLANWEREADALFRQLENVPPELGDEVFKLIEWKEKARDAAEHYHELREELWLKRMERREAEARSKVIGDRLNKEVEREIAERELAKWRRRMAYIHAQIDRITDKIILQMRRRHRQRAAELVKMKAAEAEAWRRQADEDLAMWEAFKLSLDWQDTRADEPDSSDLEHVEQLAREQAEHARIQQQYTVYQSRPAPNPDDDQAAWQAYLDGLD